MGRPRVIIADTDADYIVPLQLKFVKEFFNQIDLEIITDKDYFDELFSKPQSAEVMVISDDLYNSTIQRHNIANVFMMLEHYEEGNTVELNVNRIHKYTSIKEIFNEIIGKSADSLNMQNTETKETQIVLVTSANGGAGKTTIAIGIAACLEKNYKRVLYMNASRLQSFQYMFDNETAISSPEVYTRLANPTEQIYSDIKHVVRKEIFSYIPSFKASLMAVGVEYSIFEKIALGAKKSGDFDYIVIDAESTFDENKTRLLDIADKVLVVTEQTLSGVYATNTLISNINDTESDKYVFVCNKFKKNAYSALIVSELVMKFNVNEYVDYFEVNEAAKCEELLRNNGIRKVSFLVI